MTTVGLIAAAIGIVWWAASYRAPTILDPGLDESDALPDLTNPEVVAKVMRHLRDASAAMDELERRKRLTPAWPCWLCNDRRPATATVLICGDDRAVHLECGAAWVRGQIAPLVEGQRDGGGA